MNNTKEIYMTNNFLPPVISKVAERIDLLRVQNNLTMRELARRSGVSIGTMVNIISKNKIPNVYTLHNIRNALNISLSDFFDFNEEVIKLRGKEAVLIKIFREVSPMSQDPLIKVSKCMK